MILRCFPTPGLRTVFECPSIVLNHNKCLFGARELDFLGHHIDCHSISPLPQKVQAVQDFPQPESQCQLCRFIGLVNFYPLLSKASLLSYLTPDATTSLMTDASDKAVVLFSRSLLMALGVISPFSTELSY